MHQLIRILVVADCLDDAQATGKSTIERELTPYEKGFDYGYTLDNENARWRDQYPNSARDGAVPYDSEEGRELVEEGWESTKNEYTKNIKSAIERLDEIDCGLTDVDAVFEDSWVRHHLAMAGEYEHSSHFLYTEYGEIIGSTSQYNGYVDGDDTDRLWVVAADVHY